MYAVCKLAGQVELVLEGLREQCYIALMSHRENKGARQLTFAQHLRRKGKKRGRKKSPDSGVSHLKRGEVSEDVPVHATLKIEEGLPDLRDFGVYEVFWNVFEAARERAGRKLDGWFGSSTTRSRATTCT
jgi:hypothetical protein